MLSEKIVKYLEKNLLFEGIGPDYLQKLDDSLFEIREYNKDDLIIEQNAEPDGIYLILKGSVVIKKTTMKDRSDDNTNKEVILNYCSKNEFVGELALVSNKKRAANVYCFSSICRIIFVNTENFYKIYEIIPAIQKNLGKTIAERLGETSIRAANESSKYKKLYEMQLENSMRTTELLKSQKDFEKKNLELLKIQKEIRRAAIVETIITMINTVHHDFEKNINTAKDIIKEMESINTDDEQIKKFISELKSVTDTMNEKITLYSDSASLEFGHNSEGKKIIIFKDKTCQN